MSVRRFAALALIAVLAAGFLAGGGALLTYRLEAAETDRVRQRLLVSESTAGDLLRELGAREAEVGLLDDRVAALESELAAVRTRLEQQQAALAASERLVGEYEGALKESSDITGRYTELSQQLAKLQTEYEALQAEYQTAQSQASRLVPIRTPELSGNALLLDRSVRGVTYTGAVCSGSMEPNITCEDLLLLYEPSVTDLDVGDIIYYRKQTPDCTGYVDGRYMLHRITKVRIGSDGLYFQTKGDALRYPDPCLVPQKDVRYKLLTNVRNARIAD